MFDISFAELMMVAVVALLVIGPDKLPQVARTFGAYAGRLQRYVAQVKEEVNREVRFEELQNLQQEIKQEASKVQSSIMDGAEEVKDTLAPVVESAKPKRTSAAKKSPTKKTPVKQADGKKAVAKKASVKKAVVKKTPTKKPKIKPSANKA